MSQIAQLFPRALYDALNTLADAAVITLPVIFIVMVVSGAGQLVRYALIGRGMVRGKVATSWTGVFTHVVQSVLVIVSTTSVVWTGLNRIGWDASYIVSLVAPLASMWIFKDPAVCLITWIFCALTRIVDVGMIVAVSGVDGMWRVHDVSFTGVTLHAVANATAVDLPGAGKMEEGGEGRWCMSMPCAFFMNSPFRYMRPVHTHDD